MLLLYFYLAIFISCKTCGEEEIDNCATCDINEDLDLCQKCEDKYFPFLSNLLCLPCDHYLYGNIGCGGKCDSSKYEQTRNIICEEGGCKEGFYSIEGICFPCTVGDDFCTKCTYRPEKEFQYSHDITANDTDLKYYKCQECISNKYRINEYGRCEHCYLPFCLECHFDSFTDIYPVCDLCEYGYYVNSQGTCSACHCPVFIANGQCMVCNEDINDFSNSVCECNVSYVLTSKSECSECPENCRQCRYQNPKKICYQCEPGYYLDTNNECISCGDNCKYCELERNKNIICRQCFEGFNLNDNKNCLSCPENCESCKIESNKIICTKCKEKYGVNGNGLCETCPDNCLECFWKIPVNEFGCSKCESDTSYPFENNYIIGKNDKCVKCQDIDDIGGKGCIECLYDKISYKYKSSRCLGDTRGLLECSFCPIPKGYYDPIKDYAFITNEYKCLLNIQLYPEYLHGCLEAMHNTTSKIYECNICKPEFIPVIDEKSCRTPEESDLTSDCIRAKILNIPDIKIYTCLQCKFTLEKYNFHDYLGVIYFKDRIEILTSYLEYWNVKVVNHLGKMNCLRQNDEIQNCLEAKEDENGIRICINVFIITLLYMILYTNTMFVIINVQIILSKNISGVIFVMINIMEIKDA